MSTVRALSANNIATEFLHLVTSTAVRHAFDIAN